MGMINDRERKKQIIDFGGLQYGKIHPTDIDGCIEYKNRAVVFFEMKYRDAKIPEGQELALVRLADAIQKGGRDCLVVICSHKQDDCRLDVDASETLVKSVYWHRKWFIPETNVTLKYQIEKYLSWIDRRERWQS